MSLTKSNTRMLEGDIDASNITGVLPVANGGTGSSTAPEAASPFPAGSVIYHAANTAPTGFLKADGSAVSRSTYSDLFAAIGETYGAGDGSTTFLVPDLRGEFMRGWDDSRGVDGGRGFGSAQDFNASYLKTVQVRDPNGSSTSVTIPQSGFSSWNLLSYYSSGSGDSMRFENSGGEARPRNVALLACIKF